MKSRILFEQMLGRGTRLGEKATDKDHFTVFDCFDGTLLEYFAGTTGITAEPAEGDGKSLAADHRGDLAEQGPRLQRQAPRQAPAAHRQEHVRRRPRAVRRFIADGDLGRVRRAAAEPARTTTFSPTMRRCGTPTSSGCWTTTRERRARSSSPSRSPTRCRSEWLIKGADGTQYKPEDYLKAFAAFVAAEAETIDALSVLLARPKRLEPRRARGAARRAQARRPSTSPRRTWSVPHQAAYHKALVDIISMVKRAAARHRTAADRRGARRGRDAAVTAGRDLTAEQSSWLDRIQLHLVQNLSIDREDFDARAVLSDHGGWGRANKSFDGQLDRAARDA